MRVGQLLGSRHAGFIIHMATVVACPHCRHFKLAIIDNFDTQARPALFVSEELMKSEQSDE